MYYTGATTGKSLQRNSPFVQIIANAILRNEMAISYYIGWGMHVGVSLPNQLSREACWEFLCGDLLLLET